MTGMSEQAVIDFVQKNRRGGCRVRLQVDPVTYAALWRTAQRSPNVSDGAFGIQISTHLMAITLQSSLGTGAGDWEIEVLPQKDQVVVLRDRQDGRAEYLVAVRDEGALRLEWSFDETTAFRAGSGFMDLPGAETTLLHIGSSCTFTDSEAVASDCALAGRAAPRLSQWP